jgi:hypothetical protein
LSNPTFIIITIAAWIGTSFGVVAFVKAFALDIQVKKLKRRLSEIDGKYGE